MGEVGTRLPSSLKLRNQVPGSEKAEETHAESRPLGKVMRGVQVYEGTETDQVVESEVSLGLGACKLHRIPVRQRAKAGKFAFPIEISIPTVM
jgi:hypothetical protein